MAQFRVRHKHTLTHIRVHECLLSENIRINLRKYWRSPVNLSPYRTQRNRVRSRVQSFWHWTKMPSHILRFKCVCVVSMFVYVRHSRPCAG